MVAERSLRIRGSADAPGEARNALRRFFPELAPDATQIAMLLISELVTNAVRHAGPGTVAVEFAVTPASLRVEVADKGPGLHADPASPETGQINGWGLHLVRELASRWGIEDVPGARVWFEIDR